jgi:hypothetical protein
MWCLDAVNSPDLIAQLRPHGRDRDFEVAWVGEGWRPLVEACHLQIMTRFPSYELIAIKQKWGVLSYQAVPRRRNEGSGEGTEIELSELDEITGEYQRRSETICEWCGAPARLRDCRTYELTLCIACDARFPDPPVR